MAGWPWQWTNHVLINWIELGRSIRAVLSSSERKQQRSVFTVWIMKTAKYSCMASHRVPEVLHAVNCKCVSCTRKLSVNDHDRKYTCLLIGVSPNALCSPTLPTEQHTLTGSSISNKCTFTSTSGTTSTPLSSYTWPV